jgi:hypothetical protein
MHVNAATSVRLPFVNRSVSMAIPWECLVQPPVGDLAAPNFTHGKHACATAHRSVAMPVDLRRVPCIDRVKPEMREGPVEDLVQTVPHASV